MTNTSTNNESRVKTHFRLNDGRPQRHEETRKRRNTQLQIFQQTTNQEYRHTLGATTVEHNSMKRDGKGETFNYKYFNNQ